MSSSRTTRRLGLQLLQGGVGAEEPTGDLLRPFRAVDRPIVERDLTSTLLRHYPDADRWLNRRLADVLNESASSYLARDLHGLRAIAIETPKGPGKLKLSTIWVAERARRQGLGTRLLQDCRDRWVELGLGEVWVTASPVAFPTISPLLLAHGFCLTAVDPERYGVGRPEAVFTWRPVSEHDEPGSLGEDADTNRLSLVA